MSEYTTKVTWLGREYGCRVYYKSKLLVEGRASCRLMIGPVFRDLLRTCDKLGGDTFTKSARHRKFSEKPGTIAAACKHFWGGKKTKFLTLQISGEKDK